MEFKQIYSSSMIDKVGYKDGDLVVVFNNGKKVNYYNVPESVYNNFINAESLGRYYNVHIKGKYS